MRSEILKRGRATARCKKFAKQSNLRYTKFYKAQAATARADAQNQGAEKRRSIRRVEFMQRSPRIRAGKFHRDARRLNTLSRGVHGSSRHATAPLRTYRLRFTRCVPCRATSIAPRSYRAATGIVSAMRRARSKNSACGTARMRKRGEILKFARLDP